MVHDVASTHIRSWLPKRFEWGKTDCCIVLADYLIDVTGTDCAAHLRGRYSTREELNAIADWDNDPVAVMEGCAARIPIERTEHPQDGDVCLLKLSRPSGAFFVGGIVTGSNIAIKAIRGVITLPLATTEVLAAWAVPKS